MYRYKKEQKKKKYFWKIIVLIACFFVAKKVFFDDKAVLNFSLEAKKVFVDDAKIEGIFFSKTGSVRDFLDEQRIAINEADEVYPSLDSAIFPGTRIFIQRAKKIGIVADGKKIDDYTFENTIERAVLGARVELDEFDILSEDRDAPVYDNVEVKVVRVEKAEEVVQKDIDFEVVEKEDDEMGWRKEIVKEKGEKGVKELVYEVVYHDGKEIARKLKDSKVTKEPVKQLTVKGTRIEFGKTHTGFGSWYAQPNHLKKAYPSISGHYAANPWLPKGSYVKVTNKANGKSVIARINDRGPFGPNRIIDLDKKAFAEIASIGAGIIDVKMEEIEN